MMTVALLSISACLAQDPVATTDVLKKYGLRPNIEFTAVAGKVTFAKGETIELVGATDLVDPLAKPWGYDGRPVTAAHQLAFWRIMDFQEPSEKNNFYDVRAEILGDPDKRSFALAFRLPEKQIAYKDVDGDEGETYDLFLTKTVPSTKSKPYLGLARVLKPKSETGLFDYRLEAPGGEWKNIVTTGFSLETTLENIELVMRQSTSSKFVEVDGEQTVVEFAVYHLTAKIPEGLRGLDLRIISNDTQAELNALPLTLVTQHIVGETSSKRFEGYDLFIVNAPKKKEFDRVFTLQARPKRIAIFKGIPMTPAG